MFRRERFSSTDLGLRIEPSFLVLPSDRVFVIGSCFAREIHRAFETRGLNSTGIDLGNKYNSFSILQALKWAVRGGYDRRMLVELRNGQWFDGHRHPFDTHPSAEEALAAHSPLLEDAADAIITCDVVVITFGLVEAWYDETQAVWLNGTPPTKDLKDFGQRFSVHRTTHSQNLGAMLQIFKFLREVNPSARVICSISPVPLHATFFDEDVLIANMYNKSTLRSALGEAIATVNRDLGSRVDYFPSYELVMLNAQRASVWREQHPTGEPDGRHIRRDFVNDVIFRVFEDNYVAGVDPVTSPVDLASLLP